MPKMAALSREFYEKFGNEVTRELVTWLNTVDESYRQEIRELFGSLREQLRTEMGAMETRLRAHTDSRFNELRVLLHDHKAERKADMALSEQRIILWVIGLWLATIPTMAAIFVGLQKLGWL